MNYKVRFVDYPAHYRSMEREIDAAIKEIWLKGDFILRGQLQSFENNIAKLLDVKHAIGVNSGTDAIFLSLLAAGVGKGHEVITSAHTFVASLASVVHCGATPILVDVGEDMNMDVEQVEQLITERTKAIIPVHLNGRVCDMQKLTAIAAENDLVIIEDAAQALEAKFDGKKAGSFGLAGCFSFYPAKILGTAGDGGLVSTSDEKLAETIRRMRDNGRIWGSNQIDGYGYNSRLDNLHAAILNAKLKHLPKWIERRRELAALYEKGLSRISSLRLPPPPTQNGRYFDVYQNYVVRSNERDRLAEHLRNAGIEILISWPIPLHHQESLGLSHFKLPRTDQVSNEVLSLPLYPELTDENVKYVIETIHDFYSK
jgi:dTDP-4-amino-4,6-dideoxygalactose transaminase